MNYSYRGAARIHQDGLVRLSTVDLVTVEIKRFNNLLSLHTLLKF